MCVCVCVCVCVCDLFIISVQFESHLQVAGQTLSSHAHPPRPQRSASLDSLGGEHYSSSDELNMDDASLEKYVATN